MTSAHQPLVVSFEKIDLHNFHQLVEEWNLEFTQLEPGALSVNFSQVISPDMQLGYGFWSLAVRQEGISPKGMWTFAFPNDVNIFWRNYIIPENGIIVYAPGSTVNAVSEKEFEVMTFSISEQLLEGWAAENNCLDVINQLRDTEVLQSVGKERDRLRNLIHSIIKYLQVGKQKEATKFNHLEILDQICDLIQNSKPSTKVVSSISRLEILVGVENLMINNLRESMSVVELAKKFDISERTLLYAFKKRYNVGPKAFLKILKLNNIYHELRTGKHEVIANVARQNGFWHMGQFSKDYKTFFEELPSETLKK